MIPAWLPPVVAGVTLASLLWFGERRGDLRARWAFKPVTSALFLLAGLLEGPRGAFDWLVFAGLLLAALGDVALIPRARPWFLAGLVAFLLGHVAYIAAFGLKAPLVALPAPAFAVIALASGTVFLWLRPYLGSLLWPVLAYVLVITLMLAGAWAVATAAPGEAGRQLALAATLFFVSDLTVARDRFVTGPQFANRLVGLPLYYAAQFLFAYSIGD